MCDLRSIQPNVINMCHITYVQMHIWFDAACAGSIPGDEVVMLFVKPHDCPTANRDPATVPFTSLKRYKRVSLQPRQTTLVRLSVAAADLQLHGVPGACILLHQPAAGACPGLTPAFDSGEV